MIKNISLLILIVLVVIGKTSIFPHFSWLSNTNFFILVIVMMLFVSKMRSYFIWTIVTGLLLDIFSGYGFGVITLSLIITSLVAYILYLNYFSHHTGLALIALVAIMSFVYVLSFSMLSILFYVIDISAYRMTINLELLLSVVRQMLYTSVGFIILYTLFNGAIKRINHRFIISGR
ncbi:hypothetical protein KKG41_03580 [Patescibacteria group bacterium]|nr:hypothetical protein [Patescibacteria group bacterium]MBU1890913.1 hypothetical protein [Patescibacteria group bacterium]